MKKLLFSFLIFFLLTACDKEDTINVENNLVMVTYGDLSIRVLDNNVNGVSGADVYVYSEDPGGLLFEGTTDDQGYYAVEAMLEGQYQCIIGAQKDGLDYGDSRNFQIIAGQTRSIQLYPFQNVGSLKVKIVDPGNYIITGVNVSLIPSPAYSNEEYTYEELIQEAYYTDVTGQDGTVTFTGVPAGSPYSYEYSIMAWYDQNTWDYPLSGNSLWVTKGIERKYTIEVNF